MALPNFLIVGAAKAGTTSLHYYLKQHPDIYMPSQTKETFFFSGFTPEMFPGQGNQYAQLAITSLEKYQELYEEVGNEKAIGEACVAYLYYHDLTIPRILEILGRDVKIIISLRNPVDRAYSNYLHHIREKWEPLSFLDAIKAENWRKEQGWWWGFQYIPVGYYYNQVKAYLDVFGREQTLIILYDDLSKDGLEVMNKIFHFLEVDTSFVPDLSIRHNISSTLTLSRNQSLGKFLNEPNPVKRKIKTMLPYKIYQQLIKSLTEINTYNAHPLSSKIRNQIIPFYREDIQKLQDLIGRDLSLWLQ
ncbi:sulfotransferase [Gloeothece citriformis PCC 7424]|uniref:Sulfotransferase n=1 Tax=Gloeothece citriformis (strain PCC 7424) TaxID=65393 RepID=B7KBX3_GLOC7|nr:sulfotransferase [Gloeothece citriformis]ACK68796.1 sulfotransferase [Gloeothece citriformis PCC 7424]